MSKITDKEEQWFENFLFDPHFLCNKYIARLLTNESSSYLKLVRDIKKTVDAAIVTLKNKPGETNE